MGIREFWSNFEVILKPVNFFRIDDMVKALKKIGLWLGITLLILLAGAVWVMIGYTLVNPWVFFGCVLAVSLALTGLWKQLRSLPKILDRPTPDFAIIGLIIAVVLSGILLGVNYFTADFSGEEPTKAVVVRKYQQTRHRSRRSGRRSYERGEPYQVYFVDLRLLNESDGRDSDTSYGSLAESGIQSGISSNDRGNSSASAKTTSGKESSENEKTTSENESSESERTTSGNESSESAKATSGKEKFIKVELNRKTYGRIHKGDTATVSISRGFFRMPVVSPSTLRPLHPHKKRDTTHLRY